MSVPAANAPPVTKLTVRDLCVYYGEKKGVGPVTMDIAEKHVTAFIGHRQLASGALADVALAVRKATRPAGGESILIFDDSSGRSIDVDLRGTDDEIVARLASAPSASRSAVPPAIGWK